jgi:hypothetical protein
MSGEVVTISTVDGEKLWEGSLFKYVSEHRHCENCGEITLPGDSHDKGLCAPDPQSGAHE